MEGLNKQGNANAVFAQMIQNYSFIFEVSNVIILIIQRGTSPVPKFNYVIIHNIYRGGPGISPPYQIPKFNYVTTCMIYKRGPGISLP